MSDTFKWNVEWEVNKYKADSIEIVRENLIEPYETVKREGNLLLHGGASAMWEFMLGNGISGGGSALSYFDASNAYIGIGTSILPATASQTDLDTGALGTTDTYRAYGTMEAGYPLHSDGTGSANSTISFKSSFGSVAAVFPWNEWGILNGTVATSRVLNRKVDYIGTKQVGETWEITINITLS
jgi:hypothetical protein